MSNVLRWSSCRHSHYLAINCNSIGPCTFVSLNAQSTTASLMVCLCRLGCCYMSLLTLPDTRCLWSLVLASFPLHTQDLALRGAQSCPAPVSMCNRW
jgi:hypothetical protein